ncbi:MAG: hypothetical protein UHD64_02110 [Bacteroidales bacterium]|nr:hypothetical protein [Bacteroidales bacterium]
MNKNIISLIFMALAMPLVFTSCEENNEENLIDNENQVSQTKSIDLYSVVPNYGDILLLNHLNNLDKYPDGLVMYYDEEGKLVCKINKPTKEDTKEPDFYTTNREEFQKWADEKMKEGYIVTSLYDKKTGTYYGYLSVPPADVVG